MVAVGMLTAIGAASWVIARDWALWAKEFESAGAAAFALYLVLALLVPVIAAVGALPGLLMIYVGDILEARRHGISTAVLRFRRRWGNAEFEDEIP